MFAIIATTFNQQPVQYPPQWVLSTYSFSEWMLTTYTQHSGRFDLPFVGQSIKLGTILCHTGEEKNINIAKIKMQCFSCSVMSQINS